MKKMYQLFSNRVRTILSRKIKGDISVWIIDDALHVKICKNDLMFGAKINNITFKIIAERIDAEMIAYEIAGDYRRFILNEYITI